MTRPEPHVDPAEVPAKVPADGADLEEPGAALVPVAAVRPLQPAARRSRLARTRLAQVATRSRPVQLEPIASTLRRVARHPAVIGSASAVTVLAARAGVEVLRNVVAGERVPRSVVRLTTASPARRRLGEPTIVARRTIVEYVEIWRRSS
jgi:hypothetical protein